MVRFLLAATLAAAVPASGALSGNAISIKNLAGTRQVRRPVSVSRIFARADIAEAAQARVNGVLTETQCDVKTRWPDGSLKHAIVSFFLDLDRGETAVVDFVSRPAPAAAGQPDRRAMLAFNESKPGAADGWQARIEAMASAIRYAADAREMLEKLALREDPNSDQARYWLKGPIVTQVIVEDRSPARSFDFGWSCTAACAGDYADATWTGDSSARSLHPVFVLTFYAGYKGVKIDYIVENSWTTALQDQRYAVELKSGAPPATRYSAAIAHYAATRWRKMYWDGAAPGEIRIDHNLRYLISTGAIPNYDMSKKVSARTIREEVQAFLAGDRGEIGGHGFYLKYMPQTGQTLASHTGILEGWIVRYLYSMGNAGLNDDMWEQVTLGNAAVSGYVPIHYRESAEDRQYHGADSPSAFGRSLSIDARPRVRLDDPARDTDARDRLKPLRPLSSANGWYPDLAHQPAFAYAPYLLTGDWYFLEELYAWAHHNVAYGNPGATEYWNRRADWGYLNSGGLQTRGQAWGLRTLAQAAFAAPDGSPEKAYLTEKVNNNLAVQEGKYNIVDGAFHSACSTEPFDAARETSKWCWGRKLVSGEPIDDGKSRESPLGALAPGTVRSCRPTAVQGASEKHGCDLIWHGHYLYATFGHVAELGFPASKIVEYGSRVYINFILNPESNPYLIDNYQWVTIDAEGRYLRTWAEATRYMADNGRAHWGNSFGASDYSHVAAAALSFAYPYSADGYSGAQAWQWMCSHLENRDAEENPKWAFLPRLERPAAAEREDACRPGTGKPGAGRSQR